MEDTPKIGFLPVCPFETEHPAGHPGGFFCAIVLKSGQKCDILCLLSAGGFAETAKPLTDDPDCAIIILLHRLKRSIAYGDKKSRSGSA